MRQGTVFKRCTQCGARIDAKARRCGECDGDRHTWAFVVDLAPPGAPRKQRKKGGFATKREALVAMAEVQAAAVSGGYVAPTRQTVGHYLALWLPTAKARLRASAYDACELHVRTYIVPRIGDLPLHALTPTRARALYAELAESGGVRQRCQRCGAPAGSARKDGDGRSLCQADVDGRPCSGSEFAAARLSAKSVHNIHRTLSRALSDAVNDGLVPRNAAERCHTMPESPEQQTWSADEVRRFLAHVASDRLVALWRVAATTGIRRGELVGLRWRDVDLEVGRITIAQQRAKGAGMVSAGPTKTRRSRRLVSLDATTVAALRAHRTAQVEERLRFGAGWVDSGLVFCRPDGSPIHPDRVTQLFRVHSAAARLPWIKVHGLRHTHATLMLLAGVHPKVVQERLGHSSIAITLDTYSHAVPAMQEDAASLAADLIDAAGDHSVTSLAQRREQ